MKRVMISMPVGLLAMTDEAAEDDFTTRSEIIRQALLWYLRPLGRDFTQVDPEEVYKMMRRRKDLAAMRKLTRHLPEQWH